MAASTLEASGEEKAELCVAQPGQRRLQIDGGLFLLPGLLESDCLRAAARDGATGLDQSGGSLWREAGSEPIPLELQLFNADQMFARKGAKKSTKNPPHPRSV